VNLTQILKFGILGCDIDSVASASHHVRRQGKEKETRLSMFYLLKLAHLDEIHTSLVIYGVTLTSYDLVHQFNHSQNIFTCVQLI
jgi:hypothetical protein